MTKLRALTILLTLIGTINLKAQAPQGFNYQAAARDTNGEPLVEQTIAIKASILAGSANGDSEYSETHSVVTNQFGLFTLTIGDGSVVSGDFESVSWSEGSKFLKIEMDVEGGDDIFYNEGNVGINTSTPSTKLEVHGDGDANLEPFELYNNSTLQVNAFASGNQSFFNSSFVAHRSRGTTDSPSDLLASDRIGGFFARPYIDGDYREAVAIHMYVDDNPGVGSYPTNIRFETTPTGGINRLERMRISQSGNVGIGTDDPQELLSVDGTIESMQGGG